MAVFVAQLLEQLLLTPKIRGSNPVTRKFDLLLTVFKLCWKDDSKLKTGREWPVSSIIVVWIAFTELPLLLHL